MPPKYVAWTGVNEGPLGLVRRMTKDARGGYARLRVVEDLDDAGPASAGYNLLGQVVSVLPLSSEERQRFARLARQPRARQTPEERAEEGAFWARLPRLTAPGLDIDPVKHEGQDGIKRPAPGAREAAERIARELLALEGAQGIALRAAWSGGAEGGAIHLDWTWTDPSGLAEVHLLRALAARVARVCAAAGIPTSDTRTSEDLAWVDLAPLNHATDNRGRLWRPLGGQHKDPSRRKVLIGWPCEGRGLARADLAADLVRCEDQAAEDGARRRRRRGQPSRLEQVEPLIPERQEELAELREFLQGVRGIDGVERHKQRMAWAATLLLDGLRPRDVEWCLASAIGNVRDTERVVARTRELLLSEGRVVSKSWLERRLGTSTLLRYLEILSRVRTAESPPRAPAPREVTPQDSDRILPNPRFVPREATGGLRRLVRSAPALPRPAKDALVAHAELLQSVDPEDPAIGGLLRPSICRSVHERTTCSLCKGERGRRRIACEDELCAWCHGSIVLHEHDLALADWRARGFSKLAIMRVEGFSTLAEADAWYRARALPRWGVPCLRVRTLRYREPEEAEVAAARARGEFEPEGRFDYGMLVVADWGTNGWSMACLSGAALCAELDPETREPSGLDYDVTLYTAEAAAEQVARARWGTHTALRTAATQGEVGILASCLRAVFRRRSTSSSKDAPTWPGRETVRGAIGAEVRARREAEEAAAAAQRAARGEREPRHGEPGHRCEGCPAPIAQAEHHLMSSGRDDAYVVHTQPWPHGLQRAWTLLEQDRRHRAWVEEARARAAAEAAAERARREALQRVPF